MLLSILADVRRVDLWESLLGLDSALEIASTAAAGGLPLHELVVISAVGGRVVLVVGFPNDRCRSLSRRGNDAPARLVALELLRQEGGFARFKCSSVESSVSSTLHTSKLHCPTLHLDDLLRSFNSSVRCLSHLSRMVAGIAF